MTRRRIVPYIFPALIFLLPLLPVLFFGKATLFTVNDVMDSNHVLYSIIGGQVSGAELQGGTYPSIMGGLPESGLPSRYSLISLIYFLFEPFTSYFIHLLLIRMVAFAGMYLLFTRIMQAENRFAVWSSLCFSLLPFFPFAGCSVAGLPLLVFVISRITRKTGGVGNILYLLVFPLCSNMVWIGIVAVPLLLLYIAWRGLRHRPVPLLLLLSPLLLTAGYFLSEFSLLRDTFLDARYISHREEFSMHAFMYPVTLPWAVLLGWDLFIYSQEHTQSLQFPVLLLSVPLLLLAAFRQHWSYRKNWLLLFLFIGLIALVYGLLLWSPVAAAAERIKIFRLIDPSRLYFLQPFLWYLLFFGLLLELYRRSVLMRLAAQILLAAQISWLLWNDVPLQTFRSEGAEGIYMRYDQYYSASLFSEISADPEVRSGKKRFVCLGLNPGIAQMNGLHTIDGYVSNYPLEYKHRFREIIAAELEKDATIKKYFDHWGSRCYLFNHASRRTMYVRETDRNIWPLLDLNVSAMKALGATHLLSYVPLPEQMNQFRKEKCYETAGIGNRLYLYALAEPEIK
ncbi:MAG: hypothetical protein IT233_05695 [Bacteroidia bacterium]|nr:hypothetical protein [Bacteroidia bacterium]